MQSAAPIEDQKNESIFKADADLEFLRKDLESACLKRLIMYGMPNEILKKCLKNYLEELFF